MNITKQTQTTLDVFFFKRRDRRSGIKKIKSVLTNQRQQYSNIFTSYQPYWKISILVGMKNVSACKFHCFTVHFVSLSFIYTNVCTCF